jgi:hypothetical protein
MLMVGGVLIVVVLIVAAVVLASETGVGKPISAQTLDSGPYSVRFLAVGDWGRGPGQEGHDNQTAVAQLMGQVAAVQPVEFVVSTGDNFYPNGLTSYNDPAFTDTFTKAYTAKSLQVPWHAVLGNHDYCDSAPGCNTTAGCPNSPLHQLNISLANLDPRWHCERSYTHKTAGGRVELFFIDTSPFLQRYYTNAGDEDISWRLCPGGLMEQSWQAQLLELERHLNASTAEWKVGPLHAATACWLLLGMERHLNASTAEWKMGVLCLPCSCTVGHHTTPKRLAWQHYSLQSICISTPQLAALSPCRSWRWATTCLLQRRALLLAVNDAPASGSD